MSAPLGNEAGRDTLGSAVTRIRSKRWKWALGLLGALAVALLAWIVALAILVSDLSVERHLPALDLHDSHLVTPKGRVPFEMADDPALPGFALNQNLMIRGKTVDFEVLVGVLPDSHQVFIRNQPRAIAIEVVEGGAWYRLNAEPEIPLTLTRAARGVVPSERPVRLDFDLPPPLSEYDISVSGGTLAPALVEHIRAAEGDTHQLYLPFAVDGEIYAVNLTFNVRVASYQTMGVPGGVP